MALLTFWNRLGVGSLILAGFVSMLLLFSERSYWLMRIFFAVAVPVSTSLILLALIAILISVLAFVKEFYWSGQTTWAIVLWISVVALSSFVFLGTFLTSCEITDSASFDNQKYYLVKILYIDAYTYRVYSCEPLGLLCSRSSGYIGIPHQNAPIHLQYNFKTRKVYIQNADQIISIPDQ